MSDEFTEVTISIQQSDHYFTQSVKVPFAPNHVDDLIVESLMRLESNDCHKVLQRLAKMIGLCEDRISHSAEAKSWDWTLPENIRSANYEFRSTHKPLFDAATAFVTAFNQLREAERVAAEDATKPKPQMVSDLSDAPAGF